MEAGKRIPISEERLFKVFNCLKHPDRFKIAKVLKEKQKSYSYKDLRSIIGRNYNDGKFWQHLKKLLDSGIIEHENQNGFSSYKLSDFGNVIMEYLLKLSANNDQ
jgi:predicted transcriptional regulator